MIVTGRLALCAAAAALIVGFAVPSWVGVVILTGVVAALVAIDVIACGSDDLELSRVPLTTVRVGRTATSNSPYSIAAPGLSARSCGTTGRRAHTHPRGHTACDCR